MTEVTEHKNNYQKLFENQKKKMHERKYNVKELENRIRMKTELLDELTLKISQSHEVNKELQEILRKGELTHK